MNETLKKLTELAEDIIAKTYTAQAAGSEYAKGAADVAVMMKEIAKGDIDRAWNIETIIIGNANDLKEKV